MLRHRGRRSLKYKLVGSVFRYEWTWLNLKSRCLNAFFYSNLLETSDRSCENVHWRVHVSRFCVLLNAAFYHFISSSFSYLNIYRYGYLFGDRYRIFIVPCLVCGYTYDRWLWCSVIFRHHIRKKEIRWVIRKNHLLHVERGSVRWINWLYAVSYS